MELAGLLIAGLVVTDAALAAAVVRQITHKGHPIIKPVLDVQSEGSPAMRSFDTVAAPAPTLASVTVSRKPHPQSFAERCLFAVKSVLNDARVPFEAYALPGKAYAAPIKGPRTLTFMLALDRSGDLDKVLGLDEQFAMKAAVEASRVGRYRGVIVVEFQLPSANWSEVYLDHPGSGRHMRLGQNTFNKPVRADLSDPVTPHAMIAGTTGAGKSTLMLAMLKQVTLADPRQQRLLLIDGQNELAPFHHVPHLLAPPAVTAEQAFKMLSWLSDEILRRNAPDSDRTPITLFIDELAMLVDANRDVVKPLASILATGRKRNINAVLGSQRVTEKVVGDKMLTANCPLRLAGKVTDAAESALATGQPGMAAHRLSGKGDFLSVCGVNVSRFVAATLTSSDLTLIPTGYDGTDAIGLPSASVEALARIEAEAMSTGVLKQQFTTPAQYAWMLARYVHDDARWPGINQAASNMRVGNSRATRMLGEAQELVRLLKENQIGLVRLDDDDD